MTVDYIQRLKDVVGDKGSTKPTSDTYTLTLNKATQLPFKCGTKLEIIAYMHYQEDEIASLTVKQTNR